MTCIDLCSLSLRPVWRPSAAHVRWPLLKSLLGFCQRMRIIVANPAAELPLPRYEIWLTERRCPRRLSSASSVAMGIQIAPGRPASPEMRSPAT